VHGFPPINQFVEDTEVGGPAVLKIILSCIELFWRTVTWSKSCWLSSLNFSYSWGYSRDREPSILVRSLIAPVVPSSALSFYGASGRSNLYIVAGTGRWWWASITMRSLSLRWCAIDQRLAKGLCPSSFDCSIFGWFAYGGLSSRGHCRRLRGFLEDEFGKGEI